MVTFQNYGQNVQYNLQSTSLLNDVRHGWLKPKANTWTPRELQGYIA